MSELAPEQLDDEAAALLVLRQFLGPAGSRRTRHILAGLAILAVHLVFYPWPD